MSDTYIVEVSRASGFSREEPPCDGAEKRSFETGSNRLRDRWVIEVQKDAEITEWVDRFAHDVVLSNRTWTEEIDYTLTIYDDYIE